MNWKHLDEVISTLLASERGDEHTKTLGLAGSVLLVAQGTKVLYHRAYGYRAITPQPVLNQEHVVYDLGTLTGPLITSTLIMQAIARGFLNIDRRLTHIFQSFGTHSKESITVRHLLARCSGFSTSPDFFRKIFEAHSGGRAGMMFSRGAVELVYNEIFRSKLSHQPGKSVRLSPIDFILLGAIVEVVHAGTHFEKIAQSKIFKHLELKNTGFIELAKLRRRGIEPVFEKIAPLSYCRYREKEIYGEVWDKDTWAMGGVSGNAGVFSTAYDLHLLLVELLKSYHGKSEFVQDEILQMFWSPSNFPPGSDLGLGWQIGGNSKLDQARICGKFFSTKSVGAVSETGCCVWLEPENSLQVIFLTNFGHCEPGELKGESYLPPILDAVMEQLSRTE